MKRHPFREATLIGMLVGWVGVVATVAGFWMPWAEIDLREPAVATQVAETAGVQGTLSDLQRGLGRVAVTIRRGAETITGTLPSLSEIPKEVSGAQIPQMVRRDEAQVAVALVALLTDSRFRLGLKHYAVYLVPGLALLCGVLLTVGGRRPSIVWGVGLVCGGIAAVGFWKLSTMNAETQLVAITIGPGLWLSLWGYVGLAVAGLLSVIVSRTAKQ